MIRMEKSGEVKLSLVILSVASYVFELNGVNHHITIDSVKGAMHAMITCSMFCVSTPQSHI